MTWDNQGRTKWVPQTGAGLMLAPYFFHKTRVQKSVEEICTLFFSCVIAQDAPGEPIEAGGV